MPELLCEQITQIRFRVFLGDTASTRRYSLTVPVISNRMMLLLQRGRRIRILRHHLVVTENIRRTVNWYAKIRSLYRNASINSMAFFMAVISLPNVLTSTVFCLLLYQIIGARLTNIKIPVWLRLVTNPHQQNNVLLQHCLLVEACPPEWPPLHPCKSRTNCTA